MTGSIKLSQVNLSGTWTVDFSALNCSVNRRLNNPVICFPVPKDPYTNPDAPTGSNQIAINLEMFTERFTLDFTLTDGIGAGSNYRKLIMMTSNGLFNTFTYGTDTFYPIIVEELNLGTAPGKFNILEGCTMSLIWSYL